MVLQTENKLGGQRIPVTKLEDCYKLPGVLIGPDPNACLDRPAGQLQGGHGEALPVSSG